MNKPCVSIIIPFYNQGTYIRETIDSVLKQTKKNFECIIVNDGSKENLNELIEDLINDDNRFKIILKEHEGVSVARNVALKLAESEYILPLDSDDLISPNFIEFGLNRFMESANVDLVYSNSEYFYKKKGNTNLRDYSYPHLLLRNQIHVTCIYKKSAALLIGGYDKSMTKGYEDWEFLIRLLNDKSIVVKDKRITFYYRIKNKSESKNDSIDLQSLQEYIYYKNRAKYLMYYDNEIRTLQKLESLKVRYDSLYDLYLSAYKYSIDRVLKYLGFN
jgi:glycosyltransferase involved in cell wall biosynthesis